jgi:hypothetical protein
LLKRNVLNKVVGFTGKKFALVQFALYTYAQNVVHSFVAPKTSNESDFVSHLKRLPA